MKERNFETLEERTNGRIETGAIVKMWTKGVELEEEAMTQLLNVSKLPFIHSHISVMPDAHWGNGACVGSVIPTVDAIIPAAVGVDLGCGMMALKTSLKASDLPDNLFGIRSLIEKFVPHGRTNDGGKGDRGAWNDPPTSILAVWGNELGPRFNEIIEKYPQIGKSNSINHLGTLGTGNHFIEVCLDKEDNVWFMLHSGSRGVGGKIGQTFINLAKKEMERWFIHLPDTNLAYIVEGSEYFNDYVTAVGWAQEYALWNRRMMMRNVIKAVTEGLNGRHFETELLAVNCHHNYISREHHFGKNVWVTRKGAVSAKTGELGIIPGSMGARSYIVKGLGNFESFHSCSHGAGRKMSRTAAKKLFSLQDHIEATKGIECRKDADVIDETPGAYKNIDDVMNAQKDLVEVVAELHQVLCVKG